MSQGDALVRRLLEALARSVDAKALEREIAALAPPAPAATPRPPAASVWTEERPTEPRIIGTELAGGVVSRLMLADLLDEAILGARAGDKAFPLRGFLSQLGSGLDGDVGLALASGLNFYFRAEMDEEVRMRVGIEVSRAFYRFMDARPKEDATPAKNLVAPLLANVMNGELERVKLESVDHQIVFDSSAHERDAASDASNATVRAPRTFLARVFSTGVVRIKAAVLT